MLMYQLSFAAIVLATLLLALGVVLFLLSRPSYNRFVVPFAIFACAIPAVFLMQVVEDRREARIAALPTLPVLAALEQAQNADRPEKTRPTRFYVVPGQDLTKSEVQACIRFPHVRHIHPEMFVPLIVRDQAEVERAEYTPETLKACEDASYS